jgi:DNA-binding NtrC family response regulator
MQDVLYKKLLSVCELIANGQHKEARLIFADDVKSTADLALTSALDKMLTAVEEREFQFSEVIVELAALRIAQEEEQSNLMRENQNLRQSQPKTNSRIEIITRNEAMQTLLKQIERVANITVNVLLTGETGTGKGLLTKRLHYMGNRAQGPLVDINCASIPESLLESELFGIEKGVASGVNARAGLFEQANSGTLFMDEIGDMPLNCQAKILKALESNHITRVGGRKEIPVDVRIIAATHKDLEKACQNGSFRQDLYFRLNVISLHIPPLRERSEDIALMAQHFLKAACLRFNIAPKHFRTDALRVLQDYAWPGNVRELEHEVERVALLSPDLAISSADLSPILHRTNSLKPMQDKTSVPQLLPSQINSLAELDVLLQRLNRHKDLRAKIFQRITTLTAKAIRSHDFEPKVSKNARLKKNAFAPSSRQTNAATASLQQITLNQAEKELILHTLKECGNNKTKAAERLGISREGLRKKLKRLGLNYSNSK